MVSVLGKEDDARYELKDNLADQLNFRTVDYLPGEVTLAENPFLSNCNIAAWEDSHHFAILKKMGFALKEIQETKEYMHAFLAVHDSKEYYLHSAWDMELYKLQNAYINLKKMVFKE